ncbi:Dimeric dUTPase, all-alpha-NTP-PPase (MazG) superfamily [Lentibacillus halodurans]|uniref:Dimeric dUTPase, all-alpha-NTP-PPase (MazG) superfamily n=1 Tax=Lentibacillus halodurans TaxID=237679 RepID=A0A1I0ZFE9_9BACI|nr:dUTP diphosphatase [Lentibacillus halodurans]SFB24529.1 Dimeric dUTPase, all-alpha-NTP-PPase (MazG) superfamily [Lentibacillus halodurans]
MNWSSLYAMQEQLDAYIESHHNLSDKDLFREKYLALLVELGELANETRCFKFWSTKPRNNQSVILEEYVDGIHFMMSLGLEKGYRYDSDVVNPGETDETGQFNRVYDACVTFYRAPSEPHYEQMFESYLQLGILLGFDEKAVKSAYLKKNEINYERQNQGY